MSTQTMVFGTTSRRSEKWRLYRIGTANSVYELEVEAEHSRVGRRCVVLTCIAPPERAGETFEDSSPLAETQSLYDLSPVDWMGKRLAVGTARTSEVQSVDFVSANAERKSVTRQWPAVQARATQPIAAPREEPAPRWAPFPGGHVEMAEAAASLLKCVCHRHDLEAALERDEHLQQRMRLAFAECRLMLEALLRRH
jgi:hypothetical protein